MKWNEVRVKYPSTWVLIEAIDAESVDGKRIVNDVAVLNSFENGKEALKEYSLKHKKNSQREMYVYHTKNEELVIAERVWIGVRKSD